MGALEEKIVEFKGKEKVSKKRVKVADPESFSKDGTEESKMTEMTRNEEHKGRSPAGKRIFTFGGGGIQQ